MNKIIFTLLMLAMLVVSCGGLGGPQSSPEAVADAYLDAIMAGDCEKAATYVPADERWFTVGIYCGPELTSVEDKRVLYASPDEVLVRDHWTNPSWTEITYVGVITLCNYTSEITYSEWNITVEELSGKWYVRRFSPQPGGSDINYQASCD